MSEQEPSRPVDVYKAMIDQFVAQTSHGVSEKLVVEQGVFTKALDNEIPNHFVKQLSPEDRATLSGMLHQERVSAIHDVLAVLSWWVVARQVGFTFRGNPMPTDLSGQGLHGDYIGRLSNWDWPSEVPR